MKCAVHLVKTQRLLTYGTNNTTTRNYLIGISLTFLKTDNDETYSYNYIIRTSM
jgi:hypothetical protein